MEFMPGPRHRVFDRSFFVSAAGITKCIAVGVAHKGPINERTRVMSSSDYIDQFGIPTTQLGYFAMQFSRESSGLYIVRVGDGTEESSSVTVTAGGVDIFDVTANSEGTWGDDIAVVVAEATSGNNDEIDIQVLYEDVVVENFLNIDSFETLEALSSDYVTFAESAGDPAWPADWTGEYASYDLTGGVSGTGVAAGDVLGSQGSPPVSEDTGLYLASNMREFEVDLIAAPGFSDETVVDGMLEIAEDRQDALALPDAPDELSVDDVMDWHNGEYPGGPTSALNTPYGALSYPWHLYDDEFSGTETYVAPSGPLATIMAHSENLSNPFLPPAGQQRGGPYTYTEGLRYNVRNTDIAKAYGQDGQNINFWVNFPAKGIYLWGQKTLQKDDTALNRISAMRTLNYALRKLDQEAMRYTFQPNDEKTWDNIKVLGADILDPIVAARGLSEYNIICNEETNTAAVRARYEMRAKLLLKFTPAAEWLTFDWIITRQDASL